MNTYNWDDVQHSGYVGGEYALPEDTSLYRFWGKGVTELMLNNNQLEHKTMFEKEAAAMEKAEKLVGQIPALQSKVDIVGETLKTMRFISPEDYAECASCGNLVSIHRAQVCSSVTTASQLSGYTMVYFYTQEEREKKISALHYLCNHCDMKKFKKDNKY